MKKRSIILVVAFVQSVLVQTSFANSPESKFYRPYHGGYPDVDLGACTVNGERLSPFSLTLRCEDGHRVSRKAVHDTVMATPVNNTEQAKNLIAQGFSCNGRDSQGHLCQNRHSLGAVTALLSGEPSIDGLMKKIESWTLGASADDVACVRGGAAAAPIKVDNAPILAQSVNITPVITGGADWDSVPEGMRAMGSENLYRIHDPQPDPAHPVADFILSHVAPNRMIHEDAIAYCKERGARLPTKEEYEALGRAMGKDQEGGYKADLIPGMAGLFFWSSSVVPDNPDYPDYAFGFYGGYIASGLYGGDIGIGPRSYAVSFRCVVGAVPRG